MPTERVTQLRRPLDAFLADPGSRALTSAEESAHVAEIAADALAACRDDTPEVLRKAALLEAIALRIDVCIDPHEAIVGSQRFNPYRSRLPLNGQVPVPFHGNMGHIIVDYGRVLDRGVCGLREDIRSGTGTEQCTVNRQAFKRALEAFSLFVRRHGDAARTLAEQRPEADCYASLPTVAANCATIAERPPETFWQALQLTWFVHVFLHAEASAVAFSFGRLDQFLWPFLERDLADGVTTVAKAEELLACFWLKCCEGDESQNLVLGGVDETGRPAENPLSIMCLRVTRRLRVWQPSVSVRITPTTSEPFWRESLRLCREGFGMPSFFNDSVVIPSLEAVNIPVARARDYAIVGCYEASPQGDCCPWTVAGHWVLPNVLISFLEGLTDEPATFAGFLTAFEHHLSEAYADCLQEFESRAHAIRTHQPSPFESLCVTGCLESGLTAEEGGARYGLFGVDILGFGTLVDSLHVIEQLCYHGTLMPLSELREQVRDDFPCERLRELCRRLPDKYGTDSEQTNALARRVSAFVADLVLGHPLSSGVRPYPGLFSFTGWAQHVLPATPDGRRKGEPASYGVGPSAWVEGKTPTSVLRSCATVEHDRYGCGNPLMLAVSADDVKGDAGLQRLRELIDGYFVLGGFHLHFNIVSADQLREAQRTPEKHTDLLVRISGLSAQFVTLDERLQNGIIERTERGL